MHPTRRLVYFLLSRGRCAPCTPPYFLWFPPGGSPLLRRRRGGVLPTRRLVFSLFRRRGGVHLARRLVFIHSFPLEALLGDQRGSMHPTRCLIIFLFFVDGGGTPPHSGSFPPLLGGFFFSAAVSSTGAVYDARTPLPLCPLLHTSC